MTNLAIVLDIASLVLGLARTVLRDEPDLNTAETEDAILALEADLAEYKRQWARLRNAPHD